ncbi:NAD(P)-binding domain protein [Akanthomyces lecanii RCEF 1005]|uniref:NAD(P)-binding domain protein n=1 Tax=Akanthomyces lecanii RCEF 1005 TaxID=1081108 RepID=A0A168JFY6_CORDF|nr:NAD(P)-binding domain protein [Akanthomyces lecanii RCEF 1005]
MRDKVFAVTGGASGIGLATAKMLAERGAIVCIADVNLQAMMQQSLIQLGQEPAAPENSDLSAIPRQGRPPEVASVICFLLGPESTYATGAVYPVDRGWL